MTEKDGSRGRYAKGLVHRQRILDAALDLFARQGYDGTTLSAIAESAGMSREAIRHYFGSRDAVLLAVVEAADDSSRDGSSGDRARLFDQIIDAASTRAAIPGLLALYSALAARAVVEQTSATGLAMTQRLTQLRQEVTDGVQASQDAGVIRDDIDAETLAAIIIATSDGLTTQAILPDAIDVATGMKALETLMTRKNR